MDKLIFMVRNPRQVAKSQERLRRAQGLMSWQEEIDQPEGMKVHSPQMFIQVNYLAAKWLLKSGYDGPLLMLDFDDVLAEPDT